MDAVCYLHVDILAKDHKPWKTDKIRLGVGEGDFISSALAAGRKELERQRNIASHNGTRVDGARVVIAL